MAKYIEAIKNYFPILGFAAVVAVFSLLTKGALLSTVSMQSILNSVMTTALVSLGAVFVFGSGNFDMSMGGCVCLAAVLAGYAALATGSLLVALLVSLAVSLALGILKGLFAAYVDVPLFIVTIVLGFILSALVLVIMGKDVSLYLNESAKPIRSFSYGEMTAINVVVLALYFVFCLVIFNFTTLGREIKFYGGNPVAARQTGLSGVKIKLLSFIIGAVGAGLAAFVLLARVRSVGAATAGSMGTDVMIALVLGGMPLTGGPRARISAGLIGAATISVLNAGLTMMGLSVAAIQIYRAAIFLAVVLVSSFSYRSKLLPR